MLVKSSIGFSYVSEMHWAWVKKQAWEYNHTASFSQQSLHQVWAIVLALKLLPLNLSCVLNNWGGATPMQSKCIKLDLNSHQHIWSIMIYLPDVVQTIIALARHLCDASTAATAVVCVTSVGIAVMCLNSLNIPYNKQKFGHMNVYSYCVHPTKNHIILFMLSPAFCRLTEQNCGSATNLTETT